MSKGRRFDYEPKIKKVVKGTESQEENWWNDEFLDNFDTDEEFLDELFDEDNLHDGQDNPPQQRGIL